MPSEKTPVELTDVCMPTPAAGQILLPKAGTRPSSNRLIIEGNGKAKLLKHDLRADNGTAACVPAATLRAFGNHGAKVTYREASFREVLKLDRGLLIQFGISVLTFLGAVLVAWGTYVKSADSGPGSWARESAVWILIIAFALAALKFYKDYRDL